MSKKVFLRYSSIWYIFIKKYLKSAKVLFFNGLKRQKLKIEGLHFLFSCFISYSAAVSIEQLIPVLLYLHTLLTTLRLATFNQS
jgi:hypothetical protein